MSNKNIYDIAISELIARNDGGGSSGAAVSALTLTIDVPLVIALDTSIPDINVLSALNSVPTDWQIRVGTHTLLFDTGGGFFEPAGSGTSGTTLALTDTTGGTTGSVPDVIIRQYKSEITLEEIATPTNTVVLNSNLVVVQTLDSIFYTLSNAIPNDTGDFDNAVLTDKDTLSIASNNLFQSFYIAVPTTASQPLAIADEHGNITDISEYPTQGGIVSNFITYKFKWPVKLTGGYLHTFTLIYS